MAKFLLNTASFEEDFFSDSRLIAIGSALKGYSLCWWLNQLFGLHFVREPDMDICIQEGKILTKNPGTLFDTIQEEVKKKYYFPVFRHELPYVDSSIYLYANRIEPEQDFFRDLTKVHGVSWSSELEIETLKSRRNLII
jgi:hypothetical protein